ncbi:MAG: sulfite exporter TauE/SafE family protein [Proteobacteria bacterium]|nr:MAG: sulfite exporter TauE/SafE family protein [Pseudomonadota bacterium]
MSDLLTEFIRSPGFGWMMPLAVLAASFLGSAHCLGMCGPIVLAIARDKRSLWSYHLARLVAYTLVGVLFGAFGSKILTRTPTWVSLSSLILIALMLISIGYAQIVKSSLHLPSLPRVIQKFSALVFARAFRVPNSSRALGAGMAGALSVLMPCGHLWAFLTAAVATGSAVRGGVLMLAFVLGSLPALGFGLTLLQKFFKPQSRSRIAGVLFMIAGLLSLCSFASVSLEEATRESPGPIESELRCH